MDIEVGHNCYVCASNDFHQAYSMAQALSHRGRDSTGIIARHEGGIDVLKFNGPVNTFGNSALHKIFPPAKYNLFAFHGRYKTKGRGEITLDECHPFTIGGRLEDRGSHRFIWGCDLAMIHNGQVLMKDLEGIDESDLRTRCDTEALAHFYYRNGARGLLERVPASYTLVVAQRDTEGFTFLRDRFGVKPGCIGVKDGSHVVASEDVAFTETGAVLDRDIRPGVVYNLSSRGEITSSRPLVNARSAGCFFEFNYVAAPKSIISGFSVLSIRRALGERLADELNNLDIDFVSYVPKSPRDAASAFASRRGLPFVETFYKVRDERSFQGATQDARTESIKQNLFLLPEVLDGSFRGKKGLLVDDSLVRGTVGMRAADLLYGAGLKEVHIASYTPKIGIIGADGIPRGCNQGGVDMPSEEHKDHKFLARGRTDAEIDAAVGCSVHFISLEGMLDVFASKGISSKDLCYFCVGGENRFA